MTVITNCNTRGAVHFVDRTYMMQPEQDDIAHFVARVREIDKRAAVNHYIRTGQKLNAEPDPVVARVLEWLDGLARR